MKDVLVYSAVFDGRDAVRPPVRRGFEWRFFTDEGTSGRYGAMPMPRIPNATPRRCARFVKAMPHLFFPEYKRWIWIDGRVVLRPWADETFLRKLPGPMSVMKHNARDCIYDESVACLEGGLDDAGVILAQISRYKSEGFPSHAGLAATGVLVRDNTPEVCAFNTLWWNEISKGSVRDQLSFNYILWKLNMSVNYLETVAEDTPPSYWFNILKHIGGSLA